MPSNWGQPRGVVGQPRAGAVTTGFFNSPAVQTLHHSRQFIPPWGCRKSPPDKGGWGSNPTGEGGFMARKDGGESEGIVLYPSRSPSLGWKPTPLAPLVRGVKAIARRGVFQQPRLGRNRPSLLGRQFSLALVGIGLRTCAGERISPHLRGLSPPPLRYSPENPSRRTRRRGVEIFGSRLMRTENWKHGNCRTGDERSGSWNY